MDLRSLFIGFLFVIVMLLSVKAAEITVNNLVNTERRLDDVDNKICSDMLPCQWGVYGNDPRKRIRFHIDNQNCECAKGKKCIQKEENLSMAAFIFRCVDDEVPETTPNPEVI